MFKKVKIIKIGNSCGIILPKEVLNSMHVKENDSLYLIEGEDGFTLTPYDREFLEQIKLARDIMDENRDTLRALAE